MRQQLPRILVALAAAVGLGAMVYLLKVHFAPLGSAAFCEFGEGFSCEIVNKSPFAEVLGIPVSGMGVAYFAGLLGVAAFGWGNAMLRRLALLATLASLVFGLYLTGIEIFLLGSICVFCELSKVVMLVAGAALWQEQKLRGETMPASWLAGAAGLGAVGAAVSWVTSF